MHLILLALALGIIAGLRAMMPLAAICWAVRFNYLPLAGTHLGWLGNTYVPWIFTALAIAELYNDQKPTTPSRLIPPQFITRVVTGVLSGAALGYGLGNVWIGAICGAVGAVLGTFGGAKCRGLLAAAFGKDLPAALIEDAVAIAAAWLVVVHI